MRVLSVLLILLIKTVPATELPKESLELQRKLVARVDAYTVTCDNLMQALTRIATDFQVPMGIEWVRDSQTSRRIDEPWHDSTVSEIIRTLVKAYPGYEVRFGDVVEIFPSALDDEHDFLRLRVPRFREKNEWLAAAHQKLRRLLEPLIRYVPPTPPGAGEAGSLGVGIGGKRPVSIDVQDATLREILNRLILSAGETTWVVTYPEFPTIMPPGFRRTADLYSRTIVEDEIQPVWAFVPWGVPVNEVK
jgi:hypothetical protein